MTVRCMTLDDLELVLGWAADEGWNPGKEDATAFLAADPKGFFVKEVNGTPAAAISVVNHSKDFAFLGLYLCRPEFRGQGYGMEIWRTGLAHAGARCIGLDGVPEQQDNYVKSGFSKTGRTIRYQGWLPRIPHADIKLAGATDIETLVEMDAFSTGFARPQFSQNWFANTKTRTTAVLRNGTGIFAFATTRQCVDGIKIGPVHAETSEQVMRLLSAAPRQNAESSICVDVSDQCAALIELLVDNGFKPVFETARMYSKMPPEGLAPRHHAISTMELG